MDPNADETKVFNKLEAGDVWKDFQCPKYIFCTCPQTDKLPIELFKFYEDFKSTANSTLENLCNLISDPVTRTSVIRISRLLYEYLHEVGDNGYKVKDLPLVTNVLKFLAENVGLVKEYKLHLDRMLELCNVPPLLEKSSESLIHCCVIEQYFTLLGHLLTILPTKRQAWKVHKALHSLLLKHKERNLSAVKLEHCRNAAEKSELPVIVVNLLENSSLDKYPNALELIFLLSSVSCICSRRMLEANVLNIILTRMNLPYATILRCTRPPDSLLPGMEYSDYTTVLILDTLLSLLKCVIDTNAVAINLDKNLKSSNCALWGLCYAFQCHVLYGHKRNFNIKIRNGIAMIILMISISFPSWNLVSTGITETVIKYLIGMESETVRVFSDMIKFGRTNEDLYFEKILLLIVVQMAESDACIYVMKQESLILTILQLVNPNSTKGEITWSASQFWNLWTNAMNVLSVLTLKMPEQFLKYNGCTRLYMLLEWCLSIKIDIKIIMTCTKTISTIIKYNNKYLLECFRELGIVLLLIRLITYILKSKKITMEQQRILTLALMSAESLMRKEIFYQKMYGDYSVMLVMKLLFRCFYQKDEEFQVDQRLLLAIGAYTWECIIWCPEVLEKFIECGAIYIILDIIETTPYYCCCLFLAVLTDICDNFFSGPFLCTWRGKDKKTGLMSLLAKLWREEEIRIKAKRYADGTLGDNQLPQMSHKQWLQTYSTKLTRDVSPAIEDMIGSIRSKIYSICKIVERDNDRYKLAKEHYKMLHADLSMEDRITISTIDLYFALKLGEVSVEVTKYFEQVGINLLGIDSQALFLMTRKYNSLGSMTKDRQTRIIKSVKEEEEIEEKDEYATIRDSRLILALDAFDELDYIYRTMDKSYILKKKNEQIRQVNMALNFPHKSEDMHCHRTFQDKIGVTAVFNQHQTISNGLEPNTELSQMKLRLPLISPSDSYISDKACYSEISLPLSSTCFANIEKFTENE